MQRRVSRKSKGRHAPARAREPLAEGVIPLDKRGRRWTSMGEEELVAYAKKFMKEKGISGRHELEKADNGLYQALIKRKLMDGVGFEDKYRDWASMSDDEIVDYTKRFIKEKGISRRGELRKADVGLYGALRKRKLLDKVGFEEKIRDWASMSDEELVAHTKKVMKEERVGGREELKKADIGLYGALRRRKLTDKVGFEVKKRKERPWKKMSDEQLVAYAKKFMKEKEISRREELKKVDIGLYDVLRKRKLLDRVGFEEKIRNWSLFSDTQLIEHTREFMEEKGINGRAELVKADSGLHSALYRRKLLDRVFADIDQAKEREEAQALFDGLMEFGGAG